MRALLDDTSQAAEEFQIELLRNAPDWRKLQILAQLNQTVQMLALSGLRERHPDAGPMELRRRLADLVLGPELATMAYGPLPAEVQRAS